MCTVVITVRFTIGRAARDVRKLLYNIRIISQCDVLSFFLLFSRDAGVPLRICPCANPAFAYFVYNLYTLTFRHSRLQLAREST